MRTAVAGIMIDTPRPATLAHDAQDHERKLGLAIPPSVLGRADEGIQ
jgi:hypothetical protein